MSCHPSSFEQSLLLLSMSNHMISVYTNKTPTATIALLFTLDGSRLFWICYCIPPHQLHTMLPNPVSLAFAFEGNISNIPPSLSLAGMANIAHLSVFTLCTVYQYMVCIAFDRNSIWLIFLQFE